MESVHRPQSQLLQPSEPARKSMGFGAMQAGSSSDVQASSFESIGSYFGSRMGPSHSSSHDSEAGGNRGGNLNQADRLLRGLSAWLLVKPVTICMSCFSSIGNYFELLQGKLALSTTGQ